MEFLTFSTLCPVKIRSRILSILFENDNIQLIIVDGYFCSFEKRKDKNTL
jgi:hypothetical protein